MRHGMTGLRKRGGNSEKSMASISGQRIFESVPPILMPRRCASREEVCTWATRPTMSSMEVNAASSCRCWLPPGEVMDNQPMLDLLWHVVFRWCVRPRHVTGDTKYGTIE